MARFKVIAISPPGTTYVPETNSFQMRVKASWLKPDDVVITPASTPDGTIVISRHWTQCELQIVELLGEVNPQPKFREGIDPPTMPVERRTEVD